MSIVVYSKASRKALEILLRKIKYHIKKMKKATLAEHGGLFDHAQLQKGKVRAMAETLLALLKRRKSLLRLQLSGITHGALHKEWMHTAAAMRKI